MTFWKIKKYSIQKNDKQGKETPEHTCNICNGIKKIIKINQIGIDLWDTKIQPGLILCAIMGL